MTLARIKIASTDIGKINEFSTAVKGVASKTGADLRGPIALPTKKLKVSTRKCPCGDGKATFDKFEMRIHKRLIDLEADDRALRLIIRIPIPEGLEIEMEFLEN